MSIARFVNNIHVDGDSKRDGTSRPSSRWSRTRTEPAPQRRKPPKLRIGNGQASSSKADGSRLNASGSESLLA
jgi:hypothetical protein